MRTTDISIWATVKTDFITDIIPHLSFEDPIRNGGNKGDNKGKGYKSQNPANINRWDRKPIRRKSLKSKVKKLKARNNQSHQIKCQSITKPPEKAECDEV